MTTPQHRLMTAQIPGLINTRNPDIQWETGHEELVAAETEQPREEVRAALAAYAAEGALTMQPMVRCPAHACRTLTPLERVERSRSDGDEEPCDGPCAQDLAALRDLEVVDAYKLVAHPAP